MRAAVSKVKDRSAIPEKIAPKDRRADFSRGVLEIDLEELGRGEREKKDLVAKTGLFVKERLSAKDFAPPLLPEVAISLTQLVERENVAIGEVADLVSRDPTVVAKVVAVSNSMFYSRGVPVRSLKDAIVRMGLSEVRDVAFQVVSKTTIFRVPGFSDRMRELFDAASAAGFFARKICQMLKFESEMAYLCGLLHDMGEAIILGIIASQPQDNGPPLSSDDEIVKKSVEAFHASAGALVCSLWGLPEMVCRAIFYHHRPTEADSDAQMATVVAAADKLLAHIGLGVQKRVLHPLDEPLFYRLNLTARQVEDLLLFAESVGENRGALYP